MNSRGGLSQAQGYHDSQCYCYMQYSDSVALVSPGQLCG